MGCEPQEVDFYSLGYEDLKGIVCIYSYYPPTLDFLVTYDDDDEEMIIVRNIMKNGPFAEI